MSVTVILIDAIGEIRSEFFPEADGWSFSNNGDLTLAVAGKGYVSIAQGAWERVTLGSVEMPTASVRRLTGVDRK